MICSVTRAAAVVSLCPMSPRRQLYRTSTAVMSILMVLIGIAIVVRTLVAGGGVAATGLLLGLLFIAAGGARLYLHFRAQ